MNSPASTTFSSALAWTLSHEVVGWPVVEGRLVLDLAAGMAHVKAASLASRRADDSFWFTNDPVDPGGATAWGLTLAKAQRHGIDTVDDLKAISAEKLASIYRADYWRFDGVDDPRVAMKLFDLAVNMQDSGSHGPVIRLLQEALNSLGAGLDEDGCWGPATEASVNAVSPAKLLILLCTEAADYYRSRVQKRPESAKFLNGWLKRAAEVPQ